MDACVVVLYCNEPSTTIIMIRPLRQRHRLLLASLALLLPLAFALAMLARKSPSRAEVLPPVLRHAVASFEIVLWQSEKLFPNLNFSARVYGDALPPTQFQLELQPQAELHAPDVLVYWSPRISGASEALLHEAYLLGTLAGKQKRSWILPQAALHNEGTLLIYSLGHQQTLATAVLPLPEILKGGAQQ